MSVKKKSSGLATLVLVAVLVLGAGMIMSDDDETGRRAVHFSANWEDKREGAIEYGPTTARLAVKGRSPWDADLLVKPGNRVRLHVQFHSMDGPDLLMCWITVNNEVYSSRDPQQHHPTTNGECKVEVVVR